MLDELKHACIDIEVKGRFLHLLIKSKRETTLLQKASLVGGKISPSF
jgi:hypothetical protein